MLMSTYKYKVSFNFKTKNNEQLHYIIKIVALGCQTDRLCCVRAIDGHIFLWYNQVST